MLVQWTQRALPATAATSRPGCRRCGGPQASVEINHLKTNHGQMMPIEVIPWLTRGFAFRGVLARTKETIQSNTHFGIDANARGIEVVQ